QTNKQKKTNIKRDVCLHSDTLGISKSVLSNGVKQFVIFISSSGVKRSSRPFQPIAKKLESDWYILVKTILASYSYLLHSRK
ncbi:hypothetical protein, partial [Streptococcus suis]|uniref:hypothetical protein n=1 Tax=Streptococcus suis TaxID=1307 RepID=UPI0019D322A7